jgi:uncharacterized membrane protein
VFLTRWVTNFCVPAFVFLAGTGAFLHGEKLETKTALSKFLLVRGALLIFLEMTVSRLSWTFNLDFYNYTEANVLWAIGWCMILLAALVHLPLKAIATAGFVIITAQHIMDLMPSSVWDSLSNSSWSGFWQVLYLGGRIPVFRFWSNAGRVVYHLSVDWRACTRIRVWPSHAV